MFKNVYKTDNIKRAEHEAVRNAAGWYYFTHQILEVTGADAADFLDWMYAKPIKTLGLGRARYTTMLDDEGRIMDDVVIFRLEEEKFWISSLHLRRVIPWFTAHKGDRDVAWENLTDSWDMYAVQGPKSMELINAVADTPVDELKFFAICDNTIDGIPVKISRAGFSGEKLGYEIYVAHDSHRRIAEKLEACGGPLGAKHVEEFQIMVWTLPTEKGMYLMCDIGGLTPFEAGLERGITWDREFIGKAALEKVKDQPPERTILGFLVDDEDAHIESRDKSGPGSPVMVDGEEVGRVSKYTYGYTCDKTIGYAIVDNSKVKIGDRVTINDYAATLTERVFI